MYDIKAFYEAASVQDAVRLRLEHPQAQILAGGTDVLVQMREGKRAGAELISIYGIDALRGVTLDGEGNIRIGSLTSFSAITADPIIQTHIGVLGEAVDQVGGPQIRNAGTIGGNTCNGVTSADSASTLFAWDAVIELTGQAGVRRLPIQEFYLGAGRVDIRNAMDIATTGCSVNVVLSGDRASLKRVRIGYGVAGPIPMRAPTAEAAANGKPLTRETVDAFAGAVLEDIHPRDSWRASKAFREHIAVEMARRCLEESIKLAGGVLL